MKNYEEFFQRFQFREEGHRLVGIERECFLLEKNGLISPLAVPVLKSLNEKGNGHFGYELSACQLEERVGPCRLNNLREEIMKNEDLITQAEKSLGFSRSFFELGPIDMPLDVFPDPNGRYQRIVKNMPQKTLLSACRIIGVHVHIGMKDHNTALRTYNRAIPYCQELCEIGDGSNKQRLAVYKVMAKDYQPKHYADWMEFYNYASQKGFATDPRSCWHLIRISIHGTIEFRMFGSTADIDKIISWAKKCYELCQ